MPLISRLYTPATCTLEITARTSALSRWLQRPAIQSLQFLLRFEEQIDADHVPITVSGDRAQLETLSTAVTTYVQNLLAHPTLAAPLSPPGTPPQLASVRDSPSPYLRPQGLLTHELILGSLATETSGATIPLTVSRLFDLAEALDCCTAELTTLPTLQAPSGLQTMPLWARSAAVVVFLVGTSTAAVHLFQSVHQGLGDPAATISQTQAPSPRSPVVVAPTPTPVAVPRPHPARLCRGWLYRPGHRPPPPPPSAAQDTASPPPAVPPVPNPQPSASGPPTSAPLITIPSPGRESCSTSTRCCSQSPDQPHSTATVPSGAAPVWPGGGGSP